MLKPTVQVHREEHALVAEFWDCLRLDPAPVKELRNKYEAHLQSHGRPTLVIDLLGVVFAGSAALGLFVTLQRLVRQRGGHVVFCNVYPTVLEVFRISKLDAMFVFVSDRPTALTMAARFDEPGPDGANGTPEPQPPNPGPDEPRPPRDSHNESLFRRQRRRKL
jgi:anti-anti-sigma factor